MVHHLHKHRVSQSLHGYPYMHLIRSTDGSLKRCLSLLPQAAGRPLLRGSFTRGAADGSLLFNPLDLAFKNVANTGVLHCGDKLYALWEVRVERIKARAHSWGGWRMQARHLLWGQVGAREVGS